MLIFFFLGILSFSDTGEGRFNKFMAISIVVFKYCYRDFPTMRKSSLIFYFPKVFPTTAPSPRWMTSQVESCMIMPNSNIIPCISSCKLMNFNFNGNVLAKRKVMGKANVFDTSSFIVGVRSRISKALAKMCRREIVWHPIIYWFINNGEALDMPNFITFYWSSKKTVSFAG